MLNYLTMLTTSTRQYGSGTARRRPADAGSRRTDALVSSPAPVSLARGPTISRSKGLIELQTTFDCRRSGKDVYVLPPAVPVVINERHGPLASYDKGKAILELIAQPTKVEAHPIQISDSSDSDSDQPDTCTASIRRRVAKIMQPNGDGQQHPQISAATASKDMSPQDCRPQPAAAAAAPPGSAAGNAATGRSRAKPARVFPAMLSMLLLLLALGVSSRVVRSALSWNSAEDSKQASSDIWQSATSHLAPADAAATWFPAAHSIPQRGGFSHSSRQLLHTVAQAHKLAANLLGRGGITSYIGAALGTAATSRSPGQNSNIKHQKGVSTAASSSEASLTSAGTATGTSTTPDASKPQTAVPAGAIQMYAVIDDSVISPYKGATWGQVISHIAKRLQWSDRRFILNVITQGQLKDATATRDSLSKALSSDGADVKLSPIFVGIAVTDPDVASYVKSVTAKLPTALFWDSGEDLDRGSRVDGFAPASAGPLAQLLSERVGFSKEARAASVLKTLGSLWSRHTSGNGIHLLLACTWQGTAAGGDIYMLSFSNLVILCSWHECVSCNSG